MLRSIVLIPLCLSLAACNDGGSDDGGDARPSAAVPTPVAGPVPAELDVPAGNGEFLRTAATGTQIYTCAQAEGAGPAWKLFTPDAVLANASGLVMTHGAGPNWTAPDGSSVIGTRIADAPSPNANSIPLLLVGTEARGTGLLADTTFIQRLDTSGGVAPATGCDSGTLGTEARIPYTATYVFFQP